MRKERRSRFENALSRRAVLHTSPSWKKEEGNDVIHANLATANHKALRKSLNTQKRPRPQQPWQPFLPARPHVPSAPETRRKTKNGNLDWSSSLPLALSQMKARSSQSCVWPLLYAVLSGLSSERLENVFKRRERETRFYGPEAWWSSGPGSTENVVSRLTPWDPVLRKCMHARHHFLPTISYIGFEEHLNILFCKLLYLELSHHRVTSRSGSHRPNIFSALALLYMLDCTPKQNEQKTYFQKR